jgi:hypothetical protein
LLAAYADVKDKQLSSNDRDKTRELSFLNMTIPPFNYIQIGGATQIVFMRHRGVMRASLLSG